MNNNKPSALRRWGKAVTALTLLLLLAYASLFWVFGSTWFRARLQRELSKQTGYTIQIGDVSLRPPLQLMATRVTASAGSEIVFQGERIAVTVSPSGVLRSTLYRVRIEKPTLFLDLDQLFEASPGASPKIAVRHLDIADGTIVVRTGNGGEWNFQSVNVAAEDFNFGRSGGLALRAELPGLHGIAEVSLRADEHRKESIIRFHQSTAERGAPGRSSSEARPVLEAKITLTETDHRSTRVEAAGRAKGLLIDAGKISADFESRVELDRSADKASLSAKVVISELPSIIAALPVPRVTGTVRAGMQGEYLLARNVLNVDAFHLESSFGAADASGRIFFKPELAFADAQLKLRGISFEPFKALVPDPVRRWHVSGAADADLQVDGLWQSLGVRGVIRAAGLRLRGEQFSIAELSMTLPIRRLNHAWVAEAAELAGKNIALAQQGGARVAADAIRLSARIQAKPGVVTIRSDRAELSGGRFLAGGGSTLGENLSLRGHFETNLSNANKVASVTGAFRAERGELLWRKFFLDLKTCQPSLVWDAEYSGDAVRLRGFDFALGGLGKVEITGTIDRLSEQPIFDLQARSAAIDAAGVFEDLIRENFNRTYPFLNRLEIAGRLAFSASARGAGNQLRWEGTAELRAAEARSRTPNWSVGPIELNLPFRVQFPAAAPQAAPLNGPSGTVSIAAARFGAEPLSPVRAGVSLWNNRLTVQQPIRVSLYGGSIEVRDLRWPDLIKQPQAVAFALEINDLELLRLTEALGWHRFGGTLTGSIPRVQWAGGSLRTEGRIQVGVFGGQMRITGLEIENPFSSLPSLKFNADFQGIRLEQASETFEFGKISGILEGTVKDLMIIDGQPSELRAEVYTVERREIGQWISVEALNKITVLSSGEEASALYGGLAGFFDNFRYSKLGFRASLQNDRLTLRGIESKDGKEYLVVGTLLPPTVNVISHTRVIGFSELLRRLERIKTSDG